MRSSFYLLWLLVGLFTLEGCTSPKPQNANAKTEVDTTGVSLDTTGQLPDTLSFTTTISIAPAPSLDQLRLYSFYSFGTQELSLNGVIPLSDFYPWPTGPDSSLIAPRYLGRHEPVRENYHTMDSLHRSRFLEWRGYQETDHLYLYALHLDSILMYPVSELPLIAYLDLYGHNESIEQTDYMVGFHLPELKEAGIESRNTLIYLGPHNPFELGGAREIRWQEQARCSPPTFPQDNWDSLLLKDSQLTSCHGYEWQRYTYTLRNYHRDDRLFSRLLTIEQDQQLVFKQWYYFGESTFLAPLNGSRKEDYDFYRQFTGNIFRDHPPVILGFVSHSFGCANVRFIDTTLAPLPIFCDNRH